MFTCVKIGPVLMYFIDEGRIGAILGEIKLSDWLELSENRCARANAGAVAAQRISGLKTLSRRLIKLLLGASIRGLRTLFRRLINPLSFCSQLRKDPLLIFYIRDFARFNYFYLE
jgi:hypothetical protein